MESQKWTTDDILVYMTRKLDNLRKERITKQVELNCLSREIDNLEDMIFKIEREVSNDK